MKKYRSSRLVETTVISGQTRPGLVRTESKGSFTIRWNQYLKATKNNWRHRTSILLTAINVGLALLAGILGWSRLYTLLAVVFTFWALLLLAMVVYRNRRQASVLEERLASALRMAVTAGALSPDQAAESKIADPVPFGPVGPSGPLGSPVGR